MYPPYNERFFSSFTHQDVLLKCTEALSRMGRLCVINIYHRKKNLVKFSGNSTGFSFLATFVLCSGARNSVQNTVMATEKGDRNAITYTHTHAYVLSIYLMGGSIKNANVFIIFPT